MLKRKKNVFVAIGTYVLGTLVLTLTTYFVIKSSRINQVDLKMETAIYSLVRFLGDDFHGNLTEKSSLSEEEDYKLSMILTHIVRDTGLKYLYSVMQVNGKMYFATSSATEEELANNTYEPAYFMSYPEAPIELNQLFYTKNPGKIYLEYSDRWGKFRSVFIPFKASNNRLYIVGADTDINFVETISQQSALYALLVCVFLGAVGFPLTLYYLNALKREKDLEFENLYKDQLTGLYNRSCLINDIQNSEYPHLILINIDKFREVTNSYGIAIGDSVLRQFAQRLMSFRHDVLKKTYKAYRLHADEFAILIDEPIATEQLDNSMQQFFLFLIRQEYQVMDKFIKLGVHIGAIIGQKEEAFLLADMALREAKETNQSVVIYHDELELPKIYRENLEQLQALKRALEEDRIVPFFQPIVSAKKDQIVKYECLARMINHEGSILQLPQEFLPIAYRSRLYHQITRQMIGKVVNIVKLTKMKVTVNLSMLDVNNTKTQKYIIQEIESQQVGRYIEFEILEDEQIDNMDTLIQFIHRLKRCGCRFGLDDFGKGYSNFDRVIHLPIDFLKIDGSIMLHIVNDKSAQELVRKIIKFSKERGIETIAEHCNTNRVCEMSKYMGVDFLQGFYLGLPKAEIKDEVVLAS